MRYFADLHIHSRFSRATSPLLTPEQLWLWAQIKGIQVVATGDCVHPGWLAELKEKLEPCGDGFFSLKPEYAPAVETSLPPACKGPVRFILSTEISSIYKRDGKVRKVHNVLYMPDFASSDKLAARLEDIGNIRSDGRPILGLDSRDLLDILLSVHPDAFCVPAHIWTPWFSVLGSKSGFDGIEECFGDLTKYIYALETGLSSDPAMNWRLSKLDPFLLMSNSDAHSPSKLGREANIFNADLSYSGLLGALRDREGENKGRVGKGAGVLAGTVEFFPEEGKYHYDGHRKCGTRMHPIETIKNKGLCPVCGKPVTIGVMARVEELADRPDGEKGRLWRPYHSMIPLSEIICDCLSLGRTSQKVERAYRHCVRTLGSEFSILFDAPLDKIERCGGDLLAEGVRRVRNGEVPLMAGYDGEYGTISLFSDKERGLNKRQTSMFGDEFVPDFHQPDSKNEAAHEPQPENKKKLPTPDVAEEKSSSIDYSDAEFGRRKSTTHPIVPSLLREGRPERRGELGLGKKLNEAQQSAVDHTGSHLLIIAGPGTGKTHTLAHKIAKTAVLLSGGEKILAVTFTNKAAEEMRERISRLCDATVLERIFSGTFHRFCLDLLRSHPTAADIPPDFTIATDRQRGEIATRVLPGSSASKRRDLLDIVSRLKSSVEKQEAAAEVSLYNKALRDGGLLDFDDLLNEAACMLMRNEQLRREIQTRYRHVFVDEYQDINPVQHELLKLLVQNGAMVTAIGDPNQAIYGFRGSDVRFFSSFSIDFPGARTVFLSDNYRTSQNLLAACGNVIFAQSSTLAVPSPVTRLYAEGKLTVFEAATDNAEAEYVVHQIEKLVGGTSMFSHDSGRLDAGDDALMTFSDFSVLYRTNAQSRLFIEAFDRSGIPYQVSGEKPLAEHPFVNDILSFLGCASGKKVQPDAMTRMMTVLGVKNDDRDWETLLYDAAYCLRNTGVGAALLRLKAWPRFGTILSGEKKNEDVFNRCLHIALLHNDAQSFTDYILLQQSDDGTGARGEKVSLLTLHAAKGLEFPAVFITGCESGLVPLDRDSRPADPAEERRLFYVGMTRAKLRLYLVRALRRTLYGKTYETNPSPYLADIKEELKTYEKAAKKKPLLKTVESEQTDFIDLLHC